MNTHNQDLINEVNRLREENARLKELLQIAEGRTPLVLTARTSHVDILLEG